MDPSSPEWATIIRTLLHPSFLTFKEKIPHVTGCCKELINSCWGNRRVPSQSLTHSLNVNCYYHHPSYLREMQGWRAGLAEGLFHITSHCRFSKTLAYVFICNWERHQPFLQSSTPANSVNKRGIREPSSVPWKKTDPSMWQTQWFTKIWTNSQKNFPRQIWFYNPNGQPSLSSKYSNVHIIAISYSLKKKMERQSFMSKYIS